MGEDQNTQIAKRQPLAMTSRGVNLASLEDAYRFSTAVIQSGMAPRGYTKPEQVMIAIQHGAEVGLSPMQSLQSVAVIQGRPTLWGDALPGLAWGSGVLEELEEWIEGEGENMVAHCRSRRKGQKIPRETTFSVADAKKAKLWGKGGPWSDYPKRMLQMRARGFNFRDNLADVLKGLAVREEINDYPAAIVAEERKPLNLAEISDYEQPTTTAEQPPEDEPPIDAEYSSDYAARMQAAETLDSLTAIREEQAADLAAGECSQAVFDADRTVFLARKVELGG